MFPQNTQPGSFNKRPVNSNPFLSNSLKISNFNPTLTPFQVQERIVQPKQQIPNLIQNRIPFTNNVSPKIAFNNSYDTTRLPNSQMNKSNIRPSPINKFPAQSYERPKVSIEKNYIPNPLVNRQGPGMTIESQTKEENKNENGKIFQ